MLISTLDQLGARAAAPIPAVQAAASFGTGWGSVYEAATRADFRGYFYFPTLDPGEQNDEWTAHILAERSDWLYKNVGAVTMIIDGLALDEVGTGLWPKWTTSDEGYNKSMTDGFHYGNHDPLLFSADGHNDFYSAQFNIRRLIRLYGDAFGQMITALPETGSPGMHFIPGWRVENFGTEKPAEGRVRGVLTSRLGRPVNYRVIGRDDQGKRIYQDVPASEMRHFHDTFLPGQVRGVPALAAVAKRLFRREDIFKAIANGTLARERMGFAIQPAAGSKMGGPPIVFAGQGEVSTVTNADGSKYTVQKVFGDKAADDIVIPELPAGSELKLLESSRPGTAVTEFLDNIIRETAWTTTYPPEYIYFLAGMGQGTAVRLVLQRVKAVINSKREFQLKPQFLTPWALFFAWQRIKAGRFPNAPRDWAKHKIITPADMTVDLGREGKLFDDRMSTNKMSIETYHGLAGEDAADVEDEALAIRQRREMKIHEMNKAREKLDLPKLSYNDIWPANNVAAALVSQASQNAAAAEPPAQ